MNQLSKRPQNVLEAVKAWPIERQDAAAEILEHMNALTTAPYKLSSEERTDLDEALAEARRGDFASRPWRNAAIWSALGAGEKPLRTPITGNAGCCARTASGHVKAVPPRTPRNSCSTPVKRASY
jgi:hypothetical protein